MNERSRNFVLLGAIVGVTAIAGGFIGRGLTPSRHEQGASRRPIIQIVRQQPGLPSLADSIQNLCPSIAALVPAAPTLDSIPAFAVSADGWIMAATSTLPVGSVVAQIGGVSGPVSEIRSDPVSGLSILKTAAGGLQPVTWLDQAFPRVGDFGFAIQNPAGSGCSAEVAMVASDFLADGGGYQAYVRVDPMGPDLQPGTPVFSGNGQVIGVAGSGTPANSLIPADLVSDILDELLRNNVSPTVAFGFRAGDYSGSLAARLSDSRSRGAGIVLVQAKSAAAQAGLKAGDIVVAVNGSPVSSASELGRALDSAGKSATLDVARGDQRLTMTLRRSVAV